MSVTEPCKPGCPFIYCPLLFIDSSRFAYQKMLVAEKSDDKCGSTWLIFFISKT
jgi:hypothetical protein